MASFDPTERLALNVADWVAQREREGRAAASIEHLVIGSGYGGSVAARRLAEAGHEVVLLERGSEFVPGEFANDIALLPKFLRGPALRGPGHSGSASGLFEWHLGSGVASLTANGLGGGSLINAGVLFDPDDDVLRQSEWPAPLRHEGGAGPLTLKAALKLARETLGAQAWPDEGKTAKTLAFERSAPFLGEAARAAPVSVSIDPAVCTGCGDCCSGCNVPGAKLTLRERYLAQAVAAGATLVCGASAWRIEPLADAELIDGLPAQAPRWRVTVLASERISAFGTPAQAADSREAIVLTARHVVLAAGAFGSTELLQRSQALAGSAFPLSPALGTRFSGNGDSLSFAVDMPSRVGAVGHGALGGQPKVGPTITAVVDLRRHASGPRAGQLRPIEERVIVEDGAVPAAVARATSEMLATQYLLAQLDAMRYRRQRAGAGGDTLAAGALGEHTQVMLAMGHDGALGRIVRLAERDCSVPWWPDDPADLGTYRRQGEAFAGLDDLGAVHLHPPTWKLLPAVAGSVMSGPKPPRLMLTVHPLGGCPMGDDFDAGVVDHRGRVWRASGRLWPGLSVLDGAIVPTSLGVNPLLTITALAERALAHALAEANADGAPPQVDAAKRPAARHVDEAAALPTPKAFQRREAAGFDISLFERLVCGPGELRMAGEHHLHAEVQLELSSQDWLKVWDERSHRVALRGGRVRLQSSIAAAAPGPLRPASTIEYRAVDGWFELLPQGRTPMHRDAPAPRPAPVRRGTVGRLLQRAWAAVRDALQAAWVYLHLPLTLTWLALRGLDDLRRMTASGQRVEHPWRDGLAMARTLAHAVERRRMRYRVRLARVDRPGPERDRHAPARLLLLGRKDVAYAAGALQLLRWAWQHGLAAWRGQGVPPPRPSYWAQITNPQLVLLDGDAGPLREWLACRWPRLARAYAFGAFSIDAAQLLAQAPLRLHRGDLTSGIEAQSAYGWLLLRHALKTHLADLRAPDYSGRAVHDPRGHDDVLRVGHETVRPELHELVVRRGRSEGEPPQLQLAPQLRLDLWHYRRPPAEAAAPMLRRGSWYGQPVWRARAVLLVHAFGQSGAMYTLPEPHPSLARTLLEAGFDVWVLDHRISTRLPYTDWPSTIDQIARFDIPAALREMQRQLAADHLGPEQSSEPVQVFAFAQCIGGAALAMSLLDGRLSFGVPALGANADEGPLPLLPMLAGAVISQTHPFLVGTPLTRAKTWLPAALRDALGGGAVPLAVRGPVTSLPEAWLDRVLASLPVPADEHCPRERDPAQPQDDCATCRRIRFIEAPLFKHCNLSPAMHALLPRLFGNANLQLFAQAAKCVEHERLVDNDGRSLYVRDDRWRSHFGLPLAFLHGRDNELFDVASARRSAAEHARLYPDQARRVARALGRADGDVAKAAAWVLPGFGHVDPLLGTEAPRAVFAPMAAMFERLCSDDGEPSAPALQIRCAAAMPRAGPWIGHLQPLADGRLRVHLAFHVDDRWSGGKAGPDGAPGTRSAAFVRVGRGAASSLHRLALAGYLEREELAPNPPPEATADERTRRVAGYRAAFGAIEVNAPPPGQPLRLLAFSVHEMLEAPGHDSRGTTLAAPPALALFDTAAAPGPTLAAWCTQLLATHGRSTRHAARRRDWLDPAWRQVSRQAGERCDALRHVARVPAAVLAALAAAMPRAPISFAAASCRYPGMAVDAVRVDESARVLLEAAEGLPSAGVRAAPAFALLLGDQIYADATAGVFDPLNPVERYVQRHREAMAQAGRGGFGAPRRAMGDLLARVPTYLTQDDHELRDGWPGSGPLQDGLEQGRAKERRLTDIALDAVRAFQRLQMPRRAGGEGSYAFEQGPVRFFVLDTRTERRVLPARSTLEPATWQALEDWWRAGVAGERLNCLVSGSVLLPRLAPLTNPADPGEDSLAWHAPDRGRLLALLAEAAAAGRRFLLLSGDYHLSAALRVMRGERSVGAAVVAPPLYAPLPYANASTASLWFDEDLGAHGLALRPAGTADGSGFATLTVTPTAAGGYSVAVAGWRRDHAQGDAAGRFVPPWTIEID